MIVGNRCFGVFGMSENDKKNWSDAVLDCKSKGGLNPTLASVMNEQENGNSLIFWYILVYHVLICVLDQYIFV